MTAAAGRRLGPHSSSRKVVSGFIALCVLMAMLSAAFSAPADAQTWQPPDGGSYYWCAYLWGAIDPGVASDGQVVSDLIRPKIEDPVLLPVVEGDGVGIGNLGTCTDVVQAGNPPDSYLAAEAQLRAEILSVRGGGITWQQPGTTVTPVMSGNRVPDIVWAAGNDQSSLDRAEMFEVKQGNASNTAALRLEAQKDVRLIMQRGRNGAMWKFTEVEWHFYPSQQYRIGPTPDFFRYLVERGISVVIHHRIPAAEIALALAFFKAYMSRTQKMTVESGRVKEGVPLYYNDTYFLDVLAWEPYGNAVTWAYQVNVTSGCSSTYFCDTSALNRAEAATLLYNLYNRPYVGNLSEPFTDVTPSDPAWAYDAIKWLYNNGGTNGCSPTLFCPYSTVDNSQSYAFMWKLEGSPASTGEPFLDVSSADGWIYNTASYVWANKIYPNWASSSYFSPYSAMTRGAFADALGGYNSSTGPVNFAPDDGQWDVFKPPPA